MSGAFGAIDAASGGGDELGIAFVERCLFQDKQDVVLNPELEIADGEQETFCLPVSAAPFLFEASGEGLLLLVRLELRQQERMADTDLLPVEGFDHYGRKLGQFQSSSDKRGRFARAGGDLLDGVFRLLQVEKSAESLRLLHRVNVAALEVFNQLRLQRLGIGEVDDADGHGCGLGHLRGAVTPRSGDDLEALLGEWPHKQGRKNPLGADAVGQFLQGCILEDVARVGGGLGKDVEGKVAVLGCGVRVHGGSPCAVGRSGGV